MDLNHAQTDSQPARPWLVRIPEVFQSIAPRILEEFGAVTTTRLGLDYYLIKTANPEAIQGSRAAKLVGWNLPVHHSWPCHPAKIAGFVEKAAQALSRKFGEQSPQGVFLGPLHPSSPDRYYRSLASNLRGRALQLFTGLPAGGVEEQDPERETLFGLVGKEGLFCGLQSPRSSNGFYPGGSKFIDQDSPGTISRAGAKIAEALHYVKLYRPAPPPGSHWLELGACPGGMTSELLARGHQVTAVDRASLDSRLDGRPGLNFVRRDVAEFNPKPGVRFDAMLCDMNGPAEWSIGQAIRLSHAVKPGGLVIFTLKLPRVENLEAPCALLSAITARAKAAGLHAFAETHLTYNRHELTLFLATAAS